MDELVPTNAFAHFVDVTPDMVDLQGVVANHEIVKILVDAAIAHSDALGWGVREYHDLGAWWMVRRHEVDYLQSAVEGDALACHTWPCAFSKTTAQRRHVLTRPADGVVIARGLNTWVLIDIERRRPRRIPTDVFQAFDPAHWITP